jgi:hypothetical protein
MAALVPLFAAAVLPTQIRTLVCRFTGAIMDIESCCPERAEQAPPQGELLNETCCIVRTVDLQKLVSERRSDNTPARPEPVLATLTVLRAPVIADRQPEGRPVGPPPLGPPIILLKRSFLI